MKNYWQDNQESAVDFKNVLHQPHFLFSNTSRLFNHKNPCFSLRLGNVFSTNTGIKS
ncbi:hypothetical protein HMPREF9065_00561 [Aggregatibacter sp. oral taxon 458 str. W10330]|nr:hypothetical protein HMPREF9065_00561 [Aggregatibacter sp. oral taxon 458 str. W10330]